MIKEKTPHLQFELDKVVLLLEPNSIAAEKIKEQRRKIHNLKLKKP